MRPQNQVARDRLEAELRKSPRSSAAGLAERLSISLPTLLRILREQEDRVLRAGSASRTRYALRRPLRGSSRPIPLFRVDSHGRGHEAGVFDLVEPEGSLLDLAGLGWPVDAEHRDGWWAGLPYPLHDMRPQGFLGRSFARRHAADLEASPDPEKWHDDQIVLALSRYGADCAGNLILGEAAYTRWMDTVAKAEAPHPERGLEARYLEWAQQVASQGVAESSAAGEFPKFTASREHPGAATPHVIVKFSGGDDSATVRRWSDLLICEHLALECLARATALPVAASRILQAGGRTFLEVERFDRHGPHGRGELISLASLDAALLGSPQNDWPRVAARIANELKLAAPGMEAAIRLTWWYGKLIANSDMHPGNLSFTFAAAPGVAPVHASQSPGRPKIDLPPTGGGAARRDVTGVQLIPAPVYDMLPMHYAPLAGGEVPPREFNPALPLPSERADWHTACAAALDFWHSVAIEPRISKPFRALARANHDGLAEVRERV
ncbi:MAG: HipA domain-containing protein [Pseudomonadota bacterium]|nr:HipA domain-containing protein [Pseudomonadota bacterium]